jgi:hypothetical protein
MPRWSEPKRFSQAYDVGADSGDVVPQDDVPQGKKHMLTVNWLLDEGQDPELALTLRILAHILIGTPASPLRKALIDSGLGEDLAGNGLEDDFREPAFSTGLKGMAGDDASKVEDLVFETLRRLAREGIDPQTVAASLNTVEFRLRENNTGAFPRGILLMLRSLTSWLYDGDPIAPLAFEAPLSSLKTRLAHGERVFEGLIERYFLDNPHRMTLLLTPDAHLNQQEEEIERRGWLKYARPCLRWSCRP